MEKRQLGSSELIVSRLGLGCMSLGTDEKAARKIIEAALAEGINYFDTANIYDFGSNEKIVGQALKDVREQVVIATKVGNRWQESQPGFSWDASKAYIKEEVKQSLKRIGTDYIDLYQLHGGTIDDRIDETIEAFEELKAEGYINYYGISSIRPNVIREFIDKSNIVSNMMQYSMLDRRPEEEALKLLHAAQIGVVARGPLASGLLSQQLLGKASASVMAKGYLNYSYEELTELLPLLKEKLADSLGRSFTEIAMQYCLANPAIAAVVAGASSVKQLRENVAAVRSNPLTRDEIDLIKQLTKANQYELHR